MILSVCLPLTLSGALLQFFLFLEFFKFILLCLFSPFIDHMHYAMHLSFY